MKNQIGIFIVDDHHIVRNAMTSLLSDYEDFQVVGDAHDGAEALKKLEAMSRLPDVILMDVNMPEMNGIECTQAIREKYGNELKVLALTMIRQGLHIRQMLQAGANGYVLKNCHKKELEDAIKTIHEGGQYYSYDVTKLVMEELSRTQSQTRTTEDVKLTKRELEVLQLVAEDKSNQEIADQLHISIRTVETHKQNLLSKTGVHNVAGLVIYAVKNNLIDI